MPMVALAPRQESRLGAGKRAPPRPRARRRARRRAHRGCVCAPADVTPPMLPFRLRSMAYRQPRCNGHAIRSRTGYASPPRPTEGAGLGATPGLPDACHVADRSPFSDSQKMPAWDSRRRGIYGRELAATRPCGPASTIGDVAPGGPWEATGATLAFLLFLARTAGGALRPRGGAPTATRGVPRPPPPCPRSAPASPRLLKAYEALGDTLLADGPLDRRTAALVKVGIAVGARLEGGVHAQTRPGLQAGAGGD